MKYYIYISQTKVDMLYPQIPLSFLKEYEAEIGINLGVFSVSVKRGAKTQEVKDLPARLAAVCRYIEKHEVVGSLEKPAHYISGKLPMAYGVIKEPTSSIAFFGSEQHGKALGLVGSSESMIGEMDIGRFSHTTVSYMDAMQLRPYQYKWGAPLGDYRSALKAAMNKVSRSRTNDQDLLAELLSSSSNSSRSNMPSLYSELEFFAIVLEEEPDVVIATPLYVAKVRS